MMEDRGRLKVTEIARSALKDIIIHLQGQVIANLKIQWQQDTTYLDWTTLQDVSDSSQDRVRMRSKNLITC